MACNTQNCNCGRCSSPVPSCSMGAVRLTRDEAQEEAAGACPTVFADYYGRPAVERPADERAATPQSGAGTENAPAGSGAPSQPAPPSEAAPDDVPAAWSARRQTLFQHLFGE